ncbi:MAG: PAS domain-containing protein [Betaproteobacteria bacterium]
MPRSDCGVVILAPVAAGSGLYGILLLDLFGTIDFCNATFESMSGGDANGLRGTSVCDVFPDLPLSRNSPDYNRALVTISFGRGKWWSQRLVLGNALANRRHGFADVCIVPMMTGDRRSFLLEARSASSL